MGRARQASKLWDQANKHHYPVQSKSKVGVGLFLHGKCEQSTLFTNKET